jgi:hypothetical protein
VKISPSIASGILLALATIPAQATYANTGNTSPLPLTVSPTITKVVESTHSTNTGETVIAQEEVGTALSKLISIYERRVTRLQDEISRLRIENTELKSKLGVNTSSSTLSTISSTNTNSSGATTPPVQAPKTEQEKRRDMIVSNIVSSLPDILVKNNISASGSIGLFEFIEPKNFFISIDDGLNPAGVTAFKTKILFEYDANFNLKVLGIFELDYGTQKYITRKGANPFAGVNRIRVKNPNYAGKLLEESVAPANTVSATVINATVSTQKNPSVTSVPPIANTGVGSTTPSTTPATFADVQKSYDKNKLGDTIALATGYLATDPNNVEVLTMRARSYYIFSRYNEMLGDISKIYQIQGTTMNCGIINDGARAEKALKGGSGNTFTELQTSKCKK